MYFEEIKTSLEDITFPDPIQATDLFSLHKLVNLIFVILPGNS